MTVPNMTGIYEAIVNHYELLESEEIGKIRGEFSKIISSSHAGKGLSMIMDTGILNVILGKDVVPKLTRREMSDLTVLCQNIDKTHRVKDRRLGLFYTCMDKKKALSSIEKLGFDGDTYQHLVDAACDMAKLYFLAQKPNLKKFIYERGWDRYNYMASLEKAQRIVFDYYSDTKIKSRMFMLDEIKAYKEPIFTEDMVIDGNDLLEAGICNEEQAEKLLAMMVEELHVHPKLNTRKDLLKLAKKYKNNKMAAMTRGIHWLR